ncbi:hypothetical protein [Candidatus Palauibacter sp.]|uniref:hypothetical protein n=1 Tax=Candidatus Palauibacter sp. TaxID=3101350 RepID=UPI003B5B874F
MFRTITFLIACLASVPCLLAAQTEESARPPDQAVSPVEFARLAGKVEALSQQLVTQHEMASQVLDTVNTIFTVYAVAFTLLVGLLGWIGYTNLRAYLTETVNRKVDAQLENAMTTKVDRFLAQKEGEWDRRFWEMLQRVERVSGRPSHRFGAKNE